MSVFHFFVSLILQSNIEVKMTNLDINLDLLIRKYANGTLTNSEALYLAEWVKSSRQNAILFRAMLASINAESQAVPSEAELFCDTFLKENIKPQPRVKAHSRLRILSASAMAVVVVALCALFAVNYIGGDDIATEPAEGQLVAHEVVEQSQAEIDNICYRAPKDATRRLTLADGTVVVLNQGSTLTIAQNYNAESRRVWLNGEAYFDVAKSKTRFVVEAGSRSYVVHGTSFNILSFEGDRYAIVTLHSGKLEAKIENRSYMLTPGEELRMDADTKSISKHIVDTSNSTSWMEKQLKFTRLPLKFVANKLSHKYNTKINVHASIEDIAYTGELRNEDLGTALSLLSKTSPVELSIIDIDGEYYISQSGIQPM